METIRAHAFVTGRVQGVFFRATTADEAASIGGLAGYVANLPDGRVEVVCEGPKELVERLVAWLWHGPPMAKVTDVKVTWEPPVGNLAVFSVAYRR